MSKKSDSSETKHQHCPTEVRIGDDVLAEAATIAKAAPRLVEHAKNSLDIPGRQRRKAITIPSH